MYDLADSFDPKQLVGAILQSITFAENAVVFGFDRAVISAQFAYDHRRSGHPPVRTLIPPTSTDAIEAIGLAVADARVVTRREVEIEFVDGSTLSFPEDPRPYESYIITVGDSEWIV